MVWAISAHGTVLFKDAVNIEGMLQPNPDQDWTVLPNASLFERNGEFYIDC